MDYKLLRFYSAVSSAVVLKMLLIFGGGWLGVKIDERLNTAPLFLLVFLALGMGLGLWWLMFVAKRTKP